jgi:2-keto-3-deoxy-L-rhamnonate aldolase RhmA
MAWREKNRILAMLERNEIPLGIQVFTGSAALIEVLGQTGFDFVMLDTEHSGNNVRSIEDLIRTSELAGLAPYVRVPDHSNEIDIRRAIEAGAEGVFLPMIQTAEDVRRAADHAFIPPKGRRGICPAIRAGNYNVRRFEEYAAWNNSEVALVPMIENAAAVDNIDEICALEDVHMIVFGAGDLAFQIGEGSLMMKGPKVQTAYRKVLDAAKRHQVAVIGGPILNPTPASCRKALDDGIRIFCLGLDTLGFRRFCESTVQALNAGIEGTEFRRVPAPETGFPD